MFQPVAEVALVSGAFADTLLENAESYLYRLRVVAPSGAAGVARVDTVTPGADRPWLVDGGNERLLELSPDDRGVRSEFNSSSTLSEVVFDPGLQALWVANTFEGTVAKLDGAGRPLAAYPTVDFPNALAVDEARGALWVGDDRTGTIMKIASDGEPICRAKGFAGVASLAVDPSDGGVWVAEPDAGRVTKVRPDGIRAVTLRGFQSPRRVDFDPGRGLARQPSLWVADFATGQLAKVTPQGREIFRLVGYAGLSALHVESRDGTGFLYVGVTGDEGSGFIAALDQDGRELWRASGPRNPVAIATNFREGVGGNLPGPGFTALWVADAAGGAAWKINWGGRLLVRQGGFSSPQAITCVFPKLARAPGIRRNLLRNPRP